MSPQPVPSSHEVFDGTSGVLFLKPKRVPHRNVTSNGGNMDLIEELQKLQQMRQSKLLTELEFTQVKAALLSKHSQQKTSEQLEIARQQTALSQLELNWQLAQEDYRVTGRYGTRYIPKKSDAILIGLMPTIGGLVILYVCLSPTSNLDPSNPMRTFGPIASLAMIAYSLWKAREYYGIARAYAEARANYNAQRARIRYQKSP
jgi:hypothetical protein